MLLNLSCPDTSGVELWIAHIKLKEQVSCAAAAAGWACVCAV